MKIVDDAAFCSYGSLFAKRERKWDLVISEKTFKGLGLNGSGSYKHWHEERRY